VRKVWWLLLPAGLLAAGAFWFLGPGTSPPPLPGEATSPPGTELPEGFKVPEGSVQLGPLLASTPSGDRSASWKAILAVTGDPLDVWESYLIQLAERFPAEDVKPETMAGCRVDRQEGFGCEIRVDVPEDPGTVVTGARLLNAPDDVTGRYILVLETTRLPERSNDLYSEVPDGWEGGPAPGPGPARRPPGVGEPLAPSTTAYEGDDKRYVLLEGSRMLAQYGVGSLTGGFEVLLAVSPGAEATEVGEAYARQASQYAGETTADTYRSGEIRYFRYLPPGGAGGYQAEIWAVDRPGDRDYVFYSLFND
jgi:hypothetical protein